MAEFLSNGFNGEVYRLSERERVLFPRGDLAKTAAETSLLTMKVAFYQHAVAHLLLPENIIPSIARYTAPDIQFIDPRLQKNEKAYKERNKYQRKMVKSISKEVSVSPMHHQFSAHLTCLVPDGPLFAKIIKQLNCQDTECQDHYKEHQSFSYRTKLGEVVKKCNQRGIIVPGDDPSDWCIDDQGNVVFFEIDWLNDIRTFDFLQSRKHPTQNEQRAYRLLLREEALGHQLIGREKPIRRPELTFNHKSWFRQVSRTIL